MDGVSRDFYMRQLWDGKGSAHRRDDEPAGDDVLRASCAGTRSRRRTPAPGTRSRSRSYLGAGDSFDRALASFAEAYADQNERDYDALQAAVASGRVAAEAGL